MTIIDLLRHGEAAPGVCMGAAFDAPLTRAGWAQMRAAAGAAHWHGIVSSPLRRCADFASELAVAHGLPLWQDSRFRELGFGAWEGKCWSELYAESGDGLLAFQRDPQAVANPAPGGEPYPDFERRVAQAWDDLLETADGGHWLLVAHAGVLRAILRLVLGFPPSRLFSIHIPPACLTRIERCGMEPPRLVFHKT